MSRAGAPSGRTQLPCLSLLVAVSLLGCGDGAETQPAAPPAAVAFDQDAEAVRIVRGVRESLASRTRPNSDEVQRFKQVANRYADEPFVQEAVVAILPALEDWDGLATFFESKSALGEDDRKLVARVYIRQANYGAARDAILPIADADPEDVEANALAGRAHYFYGENEAAARYYDRVWDGLLAERRLIDLGFRAMIHFDEGDTEAARTLLEQGLELDPKSIALHNAMARVLAGAGELERAEVHSARVRELQQQLSQTEASQMRVAAQVFEINRAMESGDVDGCRARILRLLPEADEAMREQLYGFLDAMYRRAGRAAELPAVLEEARAAAAGGAGR